MVNAAAELREVQADITRTVSVLTILTPCRHPSRYTRALQFVPFSEMELELDRQERRLLQLLARERELLKGRV